MAVTIRDLERRILLAIVGVSAVAVPTVACRKETVPMPAPSAIEDAAPLAPATAPSKICTEAYEKEGEMCIEPFAPHPRATGTGEPAPAPPRSAYDTDGCLPKEQVSTGCCNPG